MYQFDSNKVRRRKFSQMPHLSVAAGSNLVRKDSLDFTSKAGTVKQRGFDLKELTPIGSM